MSKIELQNIFPYGNVIYEIGKYFSLFIITISCYIWNFTDLFIILVSTGLAERYKYLNNVTMTSIMWDDHVAYWQELRKNYSSLSKIVKQTDKILSPLIFISCFHNFSFICLRLLIGISPNGDFSFTSIYPFLSFVFVVVRMLTVMFSIARINDNSKNSLAVIFTCEQSKYTIETERLQYQLANDKIALSAMNFFFITRNFIVTVAGAVFTYEIMLLQFSKSGK
ncbi:hypothetical protein HCN44_008690 [Aphidius gifuensis]|uniref:Gustatory receptor n=1 Tax=Aphidius gifuensis TaxID=684658 RepID=A0A834XSJ8_APHGI|nr:hypothetical protein HCN44_008690 [Aphidius gifuensis]